MKFPKELTTKQYLYLAETSSDIATAIFHTANGSYKSAKILIRSSIENYFKAFCQDELPNILTEKSVFKIFESVKALLYFQKENQKECYNLIHHTYVELCKDTHTADVINMENITALKYFPSYDAKKFEEVNKMLSKLIKCFIFLLCDKYNKQFHDMHYKNKENIIRAINKKLRPVIQGADE